jgi:hypothetical protein
LAFDGMADLRKHAHTEDHVRDEKLGHAGWRRRGSRH